MKNEKNASLHAYIQHLGKRSAEAKRY